MGCAYLNLNLRMLNLFLGLCKGAAGLPLDLRQLGYRETAVEMTFQNANREAVVPELIISSRVVHHSILFEWKEGGNTEKDQLRRYNGIIQKDLTERAMLAADECETFNVTIVGLNDFRDRIVMNVDDGGYAFPVLVVTEAGLELIRNRFSEPQTNAVFDPVLNINWDNATTAFFPLDGSSEEWEYAEQIIPFVQTKMEAGDTRIVSEDVARQVIPLWGTANRNFKQQVETKIVSVLTYASQNEFSPYIRRNRRLEARTHKPTWEIYNNPLVQTPDRRLKVWHTMRKLHADVINHFRGVNVQQPIQWVEDDEPGLAH